METIGKPSKLAYGPSCLSFFGRVPAPIKVNPQLGRRLLGWVEGFSLGFRKKAFRMA